MSISRFDRILNMTFRNDLKLRKTFVMSKFKLKCLQIFQDVPLPSEMREEQETLMRNCYKGLFY